MLQIGPQRCSCKRLELRSAVEDFCAFRRVAQGITPDPRLHSLLCLLSRSGTYSNNQSPPTILYQRSFGRISTKGPYSRWSSVKRTLVCKRRFLSASLRQFGRLNLPQQSRTHSCWRSYRCWAKRRQGSKVQHKARALDPGLPTRRGSINPTTGFSTNASPSTPHSQKETEDFWWTLHGIRHSSCRAHPYSSHCYYSDFANQGHYFRNKTYQATDGHWVQRGLHFCIPFLRVAQHLHVGGQTSP